MLKCTVKTTLLLAFISVFYSSASLFAQQEPPWTMEFRIAASSTQDSDVAVIGKASEAHEVTRDDKVIAMWVYALESVAESVVKNPDLITRRTKNESLELLVLVHENDITQSDVRRVALDKDRFGQEAVTVWFDEAGSRKIFNRTKAMLGSGQPPRYMAQIVTNKVYSTPVINSPLSTSAIITGQTIVDDIRARDKRGLPVPVWDQREIPPYAINATPLRLIILFVAVSIIVAGSFPVKELKQSKHPRAWLVTGVVAGAIIGAYKLGVSTTHGSVDIGGGLSAIQENIRISLLPGFLGAIAGAGLGLLAGMECRFFVRRTIHNIDRLVTKVRSKGSHRTTRT